MDFNELDKATSPESKEKATKAAAERRQAESDLAKAYNRCFSTDDGKRVLQDLTSKLVYGNDTPFDSNNINYVSAYKNGEAGVVKLIINQMRKAEII